MDSGVVRWLSSFWERMTTRTSFSLESATLPFSHMKALKTAESALFKLRNEHHAYTMGYLALGVPFFLSQRLLGSRTWCVAATCHRRVDIGHPYSMAATHPTQLSQPNYEGYSEAISLLFSVWAPNS